jgi:hypothetical protein
MKGAHDDAIMSLSMALYAADISFNQLEKNTSKNIAMMESWTLSERTYEPQKTFYSYGTSLDHVGSMQMNNQGIYYPDQNTKVSKEMYRDYGWLFNKPK